jgi:hypothetical protein
VLPASSEIFHRLGVAEEQVGDAGRATQAHLKSLEPAKYLSQASQLASVRFLPDVDICELPFEPESFDGVSSQFGLEYASMHEACSSAVRVLKKSGSIRLLMHHEDSALGHRNTF